MRQVKNCKVGHFVKYNGVLCQVNCFYTNWRGKHATLIQVGEPGQPRQLFTPKADEKVEYIGEVARENGKIWVRSKPRDPFEEYYARH